METRSSCVFVDKKCLRCKRSRFNCNCHRCKHYLVPFDVKLYDKNKTIHNEMEGDYYCAYCCEVCFDLRKYCQCTNCTCVKCIGCDEKVISKVVINCGCSYCEKCTDYNGHQNVTVICMGVQCYKILCKGHAYQCQKQMQTLGGNYECLWYCKDCYKVKTFKCIECGKTKCLWHYNMFETTCISCKTIEDNRSMLV